MAWHLLCNFKSIALHRIISQAQQRMLSIGKLRKMKS